MSARYSTPDSAALTPDVLFPALRKLIEMHAPLGVRFETREDSLDLAFTRLRRVDLLRTVQFSPNQNLQDVFEQQLAHPFEDTRGDLPLWRLQVFADNTVIFAMHHAIGDGLSCVAFHRTLLRALQETADPNYSSSVVVPDTLMLPPIEDVINVRPSLLTILRVIYNTYAPKSWTTAHTAWTGQTVPTVATIIQPHVRFLTFKPSEFKRFSATCSLHSATVTSAVYELTICVLSRLLANDPQQYKTLSIHVPISLRPLAGTQYDDVICNYASAWTDHPPVSPDFSWANATRLAVELRAQRMKSPGQLGLVGMVRRQLATIMQQQLGQKRSQGIAISNPGRVEMPLMDGRWSIGEMFFGQCDTVAGPAFTMNMVGDPAGGLHISFTWGEESVDTAFVEEFISAFRDSFHALLLTKQKLLDRSPRHTRKHFRCLRRLSLETFQPSPLEGVSYRCKTRMALAVKIEQKQGHVLEASENGEHIPSEEHTSATDIYNGSTDTGIVLGKIYKVLLFW
ncbi:hypothetical protein C8R43DRAFT_963266 [Mycena crocata]|nr:hypothetical protein C8R43DRAFT_963266 [Mycena crocata]